MKTNKPKVQKKVAKKAAKKDLEITLTERFLEVISQLGHDAGKVGDDISKAGKAIAKKLARKVTKVKEVDDRSDWVKVDKVKKTPRPLAQSVKVPPITSAAHAEQALSKAAIAKTPVPSVKKRPSRAKSKAQVFPEDPEMPKNTESE